MVIPSSLSAFRSISFDDATTIKRGGRFNKQQGPAPAAQTPSAASAVTPTASTAPTPKAKVPSSPQPQPPAHTPPVMHSDSHVPEEVLIRRLITEGLWSNDARILEQVLNKIANLMFTEDERTKKSRRDMIYRAGGHLAIVQAMKRNTTARGVQTQGCRALANSTWETSDFMEAIATVGGIEAIIVAMKRFSDDERVQICGSCALRNLTSLEPNSKLLVELGGLDVLVQCMKAFPGNPNVQECACWTIAHVCLCRENMERIKEAHCFGPVGSAVDNHANNPEVTHAAQVAAERLFEISMGKEVAEGRSK